MTMGSSTSSAQRLVEVSKLATQDVLKHVSGLVAANLHVSVDGDRVVNYAQSRSREALSAARDYAGV